MTDLVIEVQFLVGAAFLARTDRPDRIEWPPHPDRLFRAITAARNRRLDVPRSTYRREQHALEWLERLSTPRVAAPQAFLRSAVTSYVPVNDIGWNRGSQPRFHPAVIPDDDMPLIYLWRPAPGIERHGTTLDIMLAEVTYLGSSHSLVAVRRRTTCPAMLFWQGPLRVPYPGRLAELERGWRRGYRVLPSRVLSDSDDHA